MRRGRSSVSAIVLVVWGAACSGVPRHYVRWLEARELQTGLEQHPFPVSLEETGRRLQANEDGPAHRRASATTQAGDLRITSVRCHDGECLVALGDAVRIRAVEDASGSVVLRARGRILDVAKAARVVGPILDHETFAALETDTLARANALAQQPFAPRWGVSVAMLAAAIGSKSAGLGARMGLRRWHGYYILSSYLVEYERTNTMPPRRFREGRHTTGGHLVAVAGRAEWSVWSGFSEEMWGVPGASLYGGAGPLLHVDDDDLPGTGLGWRVSLGGQLTDYTGAFSFPLFIEGQYQQVFFGKYNVRGPRFAMGIGL